jgi:regulator of replication initiation timing
MPKPSDTSDPAADTRRRENPSFFQRLGGLELFNNLLFNREKVYQGLKSLSPCRTTKHEQVAQAGTQSTESEDHIHPSIEDEDRPMPYKAESMIAYLKGTDMAVSKRRGRPPKKAPAKAKQNERLGTATTKKRSPPATNRTERAPKVRKTLPRANSGKRVRGRGASVADAVVISDSEDEDLELFRRSATDSQTPPRQTLKIDSPGSEDDLKPVPMPTPTPTPTHSNLLEIELVRMKVAHAREVECLRLQLSASEAKVKKIKEDAAHEAAELQIRQSVSSDKHLADLDEELQTERRCTSDLTWECDHLRREMEAARSCLKGESDLIQQRDEYERLYNEEKETNAILMRGLEEKNQESTRKAVEMTNEIQNLAKQIEDLQREVSDLRGENAALRISANEAPSLAVEARVSPVPSFSSSQSTPASDAELRLVNVRKTYITVKKRYDNLHSVASNISTATRSWDYDSFGEFGTYLRQLKMALGENRSEAQGAVARTD